MTAKIIVAFLATLAISRLKATPATELRRKLLSGDLMPMLGTGTQLVYGDELTLLLDYALGAGYRLIDTAKAYNNEEDIGKALKTLLPKYSLTREDIWITTKLSFDDLGPQAYEALEASLERLDIDYVDLYLIHRPGYPNNFTYNFSTLRDESWEALVRGVRDSLTRNIGVSNYAIRHMEELVTNDHGIPPAVNQLEWHAYYHPEDYYNFTKKHDILIQGYFVFGGDSADGSKTDITSSP